MVDLLDIFERDNNSNRRDGQPQRKGLRGLLDRLTGALDIEGDEDGDDRRRRDASTTSTQHGTAHDNRRRERDSFFDDD